MSAASREFTPLNILHLFSRLTAGMRISMASIALLALFGNPLRGKETPAVQIGYCGTFSDIENVKAAGFDYIELRTADIAALSDEDFNGVIARLKHAGLSVPTTYLFIPPSIKLTGPAIDETEQMAYVRKALDRVARLGTRTVVFGSGGARQYPERFPKAQAFAQLVDFCKRLAPEARSRGITIAVEPLRPEESNLINSMAEGLELLAAVNDSSVQLNLDFYHLEMVKEDPDVILKAGDHIRHVHMANPTGRIFPLRKEEYDYALLFSRLRRIGYHREISVEAATKDFATEAPRAIAFLRTEMAGNL